MHGPRQRLHAFAYAATDVNGVLDLDPGSMAEVVIRTLVVYLALLGGLRLAGKRELGQMTTFDLVVVLVIANAVQNAMVGANVSLTAGLVAAATLLATNWVVDRLSRRFGWLRERLRGTPTLLVDDGVLISEHLRREGVDVEEVMQALREHGVDDIRTVKMAVLEIDGTISVVPADAQSSRTRRRIRGRKPAG
jgi:uncharacterized membrane protein YcaP (DUF421 family)